MAQGTQGTQGTNAAPDRTASAGATASADTPDLLDLLVMLIENWKRLFWIPLLVGSLALAITFAIAPKFTSTARILIPQQTSGVAGMLMSQLGSIGGLAGAAAGIKNPADQYVGLLASRTIADALIERFKLRELYEVDFQDDAREKLSDRTELSAGIKDGIISVSVKDPDPERAAAMANAYVEELQRMVSTAALSEASQRRTFLEAELKKVQDQLIRAEIALKQSGVSASTLRVEPRSAIEEMARLRAAITAAEIRVAAARGVMTERNPDLQQAMRELAALRRQLAQAQQAPARDADGSNEEYVTRYRDYKYQEALFEMVAKHYELSRLEEASEGIRVQIVDKAVAADVKSSPRRGLTAIAVSVLTFLLLATWLVLKELLRADGSAQAATRMNRLRAVFRRDGRR